MLESFVIPFVRNSCGDRLIDDNKYEHIVPEMMGACEGETQCDVNANFVKKMRTRYTVEPAAVWYSVRIIDYVAEMIASHGGQLFDARMLTIAAVEE